MTDSVVTKLAVMKTEMDDMIKKLDKMELNQEKTNIILFKKLDALDTKLDKKYAGKWVEKFNIGVLIAVAATLIIAVITIAINGGK